MKYFYQQQEWLDKTKETNEEFHNSIINGKDIELDWNTFSIVIDGVDHPLKMGRGEQEITIIHEDGNETVYMR